MAAPVQAYYERLAAREQADGRVRDEIRSYLAAMPDEAFARLVRFERDEPVRAELRRRDELAALHRELGFAQRTLAACPEPAKVDRKLDDNDLVAAIETNRGAAEAHARAAERVAAIEEAIAGGEQAGDPWLREWSGEAITFFLRDRDGHQLGERVFLLREEAARRKEASRS
jgi:hypothetical protein